MGIAARRLVNPSIIASEPVDRTQGFNVELVANISEALSWKLGSFRPSERAIFKEKLSDTSHAAEATEAVKIYLRGWEEAGWLEEYSVSRVAKWLSRNAPTEIQRELVAHARNGQGRVYEVFLEGLRT